MSVTARCELCAYVMPVRPSRVTGLFSSGGLLAENCNAVVVSVNRVRDPGATALAEALGRCPSLRDVDLGSMG